MKLVTNWRRVATRSFSMWFGVYLPLLWLLIPELLFALAGVEMNPLFVWIIAFALATGAALRLIDQGIGKGEGER